MAVSAVRRHGVSVALACRTFSISETCYRYVCKLSDENEEIANWLVKLTDKERAWGFGSLLSASAQCAWLRLEPQTRASDLPRVGVEPANTVSQTIAAGEAGAISRTSSSEPYMVYGFHGRSTG